MMSEGELKQRFNELVGSSEIKWKIFCLFRKHDSLNYRAVATILNIQKTNASACLADLEEQGLLRAERYGSYALNGKNLADALGNALALKASKLNMTAMNLKISAEVSS